MRKPKTKDKIDPEKLQERLDRALEARTDFEDALSDIESYLGRDVDDLDKLIDQTAEYVLDEIFPRNDKAESGPTAACAKCGSRLKVGFVTDYSKGGGIWHYCSTECMGAH